MSGQVGMPQACLALCLRDKRQVAPQVGRVQAPCMEQLPDIKVECTNREMGGARM